MHPNSRSNFASLSMINFIRIAIISIFMVSNPVGAEETPQSSTTPQKSQPEPHLANIQQLTFSGKNAEAYFSPDGYKLVYQSTLEPDGKTLRSCYQIYTMNLDGSGVRRVSTGLGGTTCGYFFPGSRRLLFSSTHFAGPHCPPKLPRTKRYRWHWTTMTFSP